MNKTTVIIIIVLLSIVYLAFDKFLSIDNPVQPTSTEIGSDFSVIKPPTFSTNPNDMKESDDMSFVQNTEDNGLNQSEIVLSERQSNRQELIKLYQNKNITYATLGDILDKINPQKSISGNTKANLVRIKHNLVLSKQIATLTKILHKDVNGEKEFDQSVLDQIVDLQKQIILPYAYGIAKFRVESENDN